jgi:alpha-1,6-mannosyltransferase
MKNCLIPIIIFLVSGAGYFALGYAIPRHEFLKLVSVFTILFAGYFYFLRSQISVKTGLCIALAFHLLLILSLPALSDDYFRFLWDGRLFAAGENPFLNLPDFYVKQQIQTISGISEGLYKNLNSPHYFSIYPPVCQFIFGLATFIDPESNLTSVIIMRCFILASVTGSIWLILKLLDLLKLLQRNVLWFALNPLVIMELTGNLHFEAFMIFFILLAFYFFGLKRYHFSAISLGFAVCSKLLPLMLLPFIIKKLGFRQGLVYCSITGLTCLILFLPFLNAELIAHFSNSLNLYFQKFEFNASVYYMVRTIGFYFYGYNQIAFIGPLLSVFTCASILFLAFGPKNATFEKLPRSFLIALTIYFALATIVHPWYLTTLVALATLTNFRFPIAWSGLAILSYSAYQTNSYTENPWLLVVEYFGLLAAILFENRKNFRTANSTLPIQET